MGMQGWQAGRQGLVWFQWAKELWVQLQLTIKRVQGKGLAAGACPGCR